jgi:DNA mismatch repair protein MutS
MAKAVTETPLMQQHNAIKQKYPDAILLFRVGDFYETFGKDAIITSKILGITLTRRNNGAANSLELAGFPHHALDTYVHKLVKAGYRVAVCDQLEDPKQAKGIVKRGVTEMITPGTATHDRIIDREQNNFLAAIHYIDTNNIGLSLVDLSTGECLIGEGNEEYIDKLIQSFKPTEIVYEKKWKAWFHEKFGSSFYSYLLDEWILTKQYTEDLLLQQFGTISLKGFGVEHMPHALIAAGAVLHYLKDTEHPNLQHILSIKRIEKDDFMWLDRFTIRNLELINSIHEKGATLLQVIDKTSSPMGARLLRRWVIFPLVKEHVIQERLNAVENLIGNTNNTPLLINIISAIGDIERISAKISSKKINPRELLQLAASLQHCGNLKQLLNEYNNTYCKKLQEQIQESSYIHQKIIDSIMENPPIQTNKGGFINNGVHAELDELRSISKDGKNYLLQLQHNEATITGISSLKIGYNNVFGYYLEVTNTHKDKVPDTWIRKQTLTNAERYITEELKAYEEKILGAEDKIINIENSLYQQLIDELLEYLPIFQQNAYVIAQIDILCNYATIAKDNNYIKPVITKEEALQIKEGRHPVIEKNMKPGETYIPNDIYLDNKEQQIIILTGPNMSGKSAILRQTALITLMAHMGCYVPAKEATIPLTEKIFTRVGASDNLSEGESTFMVEMNETASIMNNIDNRCLILLDEIGRGTSTYDGISIAWSLVEHLQQSNAKPKTLFATHYHELNELENKLEGIKNYHVSNKEVGNKIVFLRKMVAGGSKHSFGIHVAKMAGMPLSIVERSHEILKQLEKEHANLDSKVQHIHKETKMQLNIFDQHSEVFDSIRTSLAEIDINRLTPVEALLKLQEIKKQIGT